MKSRQTLNLTSKRYDLKKSKSELIAKEISCEHSLIAQRMGWNLTFQGFLFGGYAVLIVNIDEFSERVSILEIFTFALSVAGTVITLATLIGVGAAMRRIYDLRKSWESSVGLSSGVPKPFSDGLGEALGFLPALVIGATLMATWICLIIFMDFSLPAKNVEPTQTFECNMISVPDANQKCIDKILAKPSGGSAE
jgi:hypothetical protein